MPAVGAIAAVVSAAAGVAGVVNAKKAAEDQKEQFEKQKIEAANAAALERTRTEAGANVKLGTPDGGRGGGKAVSPAARTGVVSNAVGGVSASKRVGL